MLTFHFGFESYLGPVKTCMKRCLNILLGDHVAPGPLWLLLELGWEEPRVGTTVTLQMLVTGPAANHRPPFQLLTNHSPGQPRCSALQCGRCSRHHAGQDTEYQDTNQTGITRIDMDSLPKIKVVHFALKQYHVFFAGRWKQYIKIRKRLENDPGNY